jgi:hypothetical protein
LRSDRETKMFISRGQFIIWNRTRKRIGNTWLLCSGWQHRRQGRSQLAVIVWSEKEEKDWSGWEGEEEEGMIGEEGVVGDEDQVEGKLNDISEIGTSKETWFRKEPSVNVCMRFKAKWKIFSWKTTPLEVKTDCVCRL